MGRRSGSSFNHYNTLSRRSSGNHQKFSLSRARRKRADLSHRAKDASLDTIGVSFIKVKF